ncbi:MAG: ABC transporter substrate-binding protein [Dehalococcoidia bacterium]
MASDYWNRFNEMRASRRRFLGAGAAGGAGLAGLALVGCGDDDDAASPTAAPAGTTTAAASASAAPTEAVTRGGTWRSPLNGVSSGNPPTLYPYENLTYLAQFPSGNHYSRLLRQKTGKDVAVENKTSLEGDFISKYEQVDPVTIRFTMKPNVKWHNKAPLNGRAATATDFVKTYEAFSKVSQNAAKFGAVIDSVTAPDEKTILIKLKNPFAPFLAAMAASSEGIWFIPVETIDSGQVKQEPLGTGPYVFKEFQTGVSMKWDKNPDYYDSPLPNYDKLEWGLSNDAQRIVAALQAGELDYSGLNGVIYKESRSKLDPKGTDIFSQNFVFSGVYFNFDNKPFQDKRVRQAISMLLDRDGYLKVQDGTGKGNWHSHISPGLAPYYISPKDSKFGPNAKWYQKNIAEAKALLTAAGADNLQGIKLIGNVDRYGPEAKQAWELISADLKAGGFNHELVFQEYATYIQTVYLGKMEPNTFAVGPLIGSPSDPDDVFVTNIWSKSARKNWGGTPIPEQAAIDADIEKQRTILDQNERVAFIQEMQRKMAESMVIVPYHASAGYAYVQPWVQNYYAMADYSYVANSAMKSNFTKERIAKG